MIMDIAERIKYLRKTHLKMSRDSFAEILGTSASVIYNIENDRLKNPTSKNPIYKLICETFNVSEEWLMEGIGEIEIAKSQSEEIVDFAADLINVDDAAFKKRLITALAKLDENGWNVLEKLIDEISAENEKG